MLTDDIPVTMNVNVELWEIDKRYKYYCFDYRYSH